MRRRTMTTGCLHLIYNTSIISWSHHFSKIITKPSRCKKFPGWSIVLHASFDGEEIVPVVTIQMFNHLDNTPFTWCGLIEQKCRISCLQVGGFSDTLSCCSFQFADQYLALNFFHDL